MEIEWIDRVYDPTLGSNRRFDVYETKYGLYLFTPQQAEKIKEKMDNGIPPSSGGPFKQIYINNRIMYKHDEYPPMEYWFISFET